MKWMQVIAVFITLLVVSSSCQTDGPRNTEALFTSLDARSTGIDFTNQVNPTEQLNIFSYRNFYNGGGVGLGDIDNDGLLDVFLTANQEPNRLFLNRGNLKFADITSSAGIAGQQLWTTGVAMADINEDGWLDIYVCYSGLNDGQPKPNELFINQGDATFVESAREFGLADPGFGTHALFFDYDRDGDLDCFVLNNSLQTPDRIRFSEGIGRERDDQSGDQFYRNDGGRFVRVTESVGIMPSKIGFGLGASVVDVNADGHLDIYVSNDFWERDYCYVNQGDGTFIEMLPDLFSHTSMSSMGSDVGDIDNDGDDDIFTTDMLPPGQYRIQTMTEFENEIVRDPDYVARYHYQYLQNCLQLNQGSRRRFAEVANLSRVAASDWSWGALLFDLDLDGWRDIFVANGIYRNITDLDFRDFIANSSELQEARRAGQAISLVELSKRMRSQPVPNCTFVNDGSGRFDDLATQLGLGDPTFSNGAAYGDLDNDGDMDLVINNLNMPGSVYESQASEHNHYIQIKLQGPPGNAQAIGTKVSLYIPDFIQSSTVMPNRGFQSSVDPRLLFGIGNYTQADSLAIIWPDGTRQVYLNPPVDSMLVVSYSGQVGSARKGVPSEPSLFRKIATDEHLFVDGVPRHREDDFDDFDYEALLPHRLSNLGPHLATADVNKDGQQDLLVLGGAGQPDRIYLQRIDGRFELSEQPELEIDRSAESTCAVFFDADNDNDLDLLIGSGGNNVTLGNEAYTARFYLNDSKGRFRKAVFEAPPIIGNLSCLKAADVDRDGDLDLFAGALCVPGNYGLIPRSFLIRNDGSLVWTDITPPNLGELGMVTDAEWIRDPDTGLPDLLVVGEWIPITRFINVAGELKEVDRLPNTSGWWQSITPADLDSDGQMDYILGNWGLNSRLQADPERPLSMHVRDFDSNGKSEFIITAHTLGDDQAFPIASRLALTKQLPELRKTAPSFHEFALLPYDDLFNETQRAAATTWQVTELRSGVLMHTDTGLIFQPLPHQAQAAPVFAALPVYTDSDHADILLFGNQSGLPPFLGRQVANYGEMFSFIEGSYQPVSSKTGLTIEGEIRDAVSLRAASGGTLYVLGKNDGDLVTFEQVSDE